MTHDPCHQRDKLGLFILSGLALVIIGVVVLGCFRKGIPDKADVLLGSVTTGLLLYGRDIINVIRSSWQEQTMSKMGDQLAASPGAGGPTPADAKEGAELVADAAADKADEIGGGK